ncbi:unnamed protein product [Rotaria sp. Silwood2]|nr:unnamed protein product [Rotaria sp. Silwood2]CAF4185353.1 unnamed protein product [Rotaria sp. Silwood2]
MGSTSLDTFDSNKNDYASNFMIGGSAGYLGFKIGGLYSNEYQRIKEEQKETKSITLHNQIDYLMVDTILLPTCSLMSHVKKELIKIAEYVLTDQPLMATYAAELFVKKYGTHYTSRLYLGGSISEEDFISESDYSPSEMNKKLYKAAVEASFLGSFSLSASFSSGSSLSQNDISRFKQQIQRKIINSKVKTKPAIIRRAIENITSIIQPEKIPELTLVGLVEVKKKMNDAIETYIEMNTHRGCMNRLSPSFNWVANVDDSSCAPATVKFQFGGFIQTCTEDSRLQQ